MSANEKILTSQNFAESIRSGVSLVDFYADWCMPCRMLAPTIASIADEYAGKVTVGKLNIDQAQDIAAQYGVMSIPTVILFKDGKLIDKKVGMSPKPVYQKLLDENLA